MTLRDALRYAWPILREGLSLWAPQIKIPADVVRLAMGHLGKTKRTTRKIKSRVEKIDRMILDAEARIDELKDERERLVVDWGDLDYIIEQLMRLRKGDLHG